METQTAHTLDVHRNQAVSLDYNASYAAVNARAKQIAQDVLALTGGRTTYSWEGNGIRIAYAGDTVNDAGEPTFGPTVREYLVDGSYRTVAPEPSQSGTGLLNLHLGHVTGCDDPVVVAKREIAFLLLDPTLDIVGFVMRTSTAWHGLMNEPFQIRNALAIRLAEVIEQKVLENPGAGLNLHELADDGEAVNIVGYMVKMLDGTIFNLMRRVLANEAKHMTTLDRDHDEDDANRVFVAEQDEHLLPRSAEHEAIYGQDEARAAAELESMSAELEDVATARAAGTTVRTRRKAEKDALIARRFLTQTGLPSIVLPDLSTRRALVAEVTAELKARTEAAEKSENPEQFDLESSDLVLRSFMAWRNLLLSECHPGDELVSDKWFSIWESFTEADTDIMMMHLGGGRAARLTKVVLGLLRPAEKMTEASRRRCAASLIAQLPDADERMQELAAGAVAAFANLQQDDGAETAAAWDEAASAFFAHPAAPVKDPAELMALIQEAQFSLGVTA